MKIKLNNILKRTKEEIEIIPKKEKRRKIENKSNIDKLKTGFENLVFNKNHFSKGTYTLLFFMFSLAIISVTMTYKSYKMLNEEEYSSYISQDEVQAVSNISSEIVEQDKITNNNDVEKQKNEEESSSNTELVQETLDFKSPIETLQIQKIYSIDKLIYSKTLEMWKTHDGIDISAKMGEAVYASEKGVVEKIFNDSFLGMTVVISHIANYKTSYSNLSENVPVKVGQTVKQGQRIGNISDTSIGEIKDEPHLHFMVYKNNETIDPGSVLD